MLISPSYSLLGIIFSLVPLLLTIYLHPKTFRKYLRIITIIAVVSTIIWSLSDQVAFKEQIWEVTNEESLGIRIGYLPIEEIIFAAICSIIIPLVTILVYNSHKRNKRFRDIYFVKE